MSSHISLSINERIRLLINDIGESQNSIAKKLGVNQSFLSKVVRGLSKPSVEMLSGITEAYRNVNAEWLLTGNGPMYKTPSTETAKTQSEAGQGVDTNREMEKLVELLEQLPEPERSETIKEIQMLGHEKAKLARYRMELEELKRKVG